LRVSKSWKIDLIFNQPFTSYLRHIWRRNSTELYLISFFIEWLAQFLIKGLCRSSKQLN